MNIQPNPATHRSLVETLRPSAHTQRSSPSTEADGGHDGGADALLNTSQPAKTPGIGIYTPNGTLNAAASLAQTLRAQLQAVGDGDGDNDGK